MANLLVGALDAPFVRMYSVRFSLSAVIIETLEVVGEAMLAEHF